MLVSAIAEARGRERDQLPGAWYPRWQQLAVTTPNGPWAHAWPTASMWRHASKALAEALDLAEPPQRLECFGSHSSGGGYRGFLVVLARKGR